MKSTSTHINYELLARFVSNQASEAEIDRIQVWAQSDPARLKMIEELQSIWAASASMEGYNPPDIQQAWERFCKELPNHPPLKNRFRLSPLLKYAALLVLVSGTALLFWLFMKRPPNEDGLIVQAGTSALTDTLSDGSRITLNRNSVVAVSQQFNQKERSVKIAGEAFFQVKPDRAKPFIVSASGINIKVTGTSFHVSNKGDTVEVIVASGKVMVSNEDSTVELVAGEKLRTAKGSKELTKEINSDPLYNYYLTRSFICYNTPLNQLVEALNQAFEARIVIARPGVGQQMLTTTFNEQSLDQILTIISESLDLKIVHANGNILLK